MDGRRSSNITDITRIAREAASAQSPNLRVMGGTIGGWRRDYAEVVIDREECRQSPCRVSVGVFRNTSPEAIRAEIIQHLERHVPEHGI